MIDAGTASPKESILTYSYREIGTIIGKDIAKKDIIRILNSLRLATTEKGDILTTVIPNYRDDIAGVNDLTEEVIRMYGYDFIESRLVSRQRGGRTEKQTRFEQIKEGLVGHGVSEIISYSFITPKAFDLLQLENENLLRQAVTLKNPLGADLSVMRTTLSFSMLKTISTNNARGNKELRLFETAKTYLPKTLPLNELPDEKNVLSIGFYGDGEDYYTLKAVVDDLLNVLGITVDYSRETLDYMHPNKTARLSTKDGTFLGYLGEVHPDVREKFNLERRCYIAELNLEYLIENGRDIKPYKFISRYQAMERDLALLTPIQTPVSALLSCIKENASGILEEAEVFDVYSGGQIDAGRKSVAIQLVFRHPERTLTDADVTLEIESILNALGKIDVVLRI